MNVFLCFFVVDGVGGRGRRMFSESESVSVFGHFISFFFKKNVI